MIEEHHEDAEETEQVVRGTGRGRENTEYDHLSSLLLQKMETSLSGLLTTSGVCHKIPFPPTQSKALSMVFTFIYFSNSKSNLSPNRKYTDSTMEIPTLVTCYSQPCCPVKGPLVPIPL